MFERRGLLKGQINTHGTSDVSRETVITMKRITCAGDFQAMFSVSRETLDRLETYAELLAKWQRTINLVAPNTIPDIWHRHFADSAQIYRLVPAQASHLVDLGSGGGFPGLVLTALAVGDSSRNTSGRALAVTLVESDTRKAAFLREAARQLGIAVDILSSRIESITNSDSLERVDVITSRALAPLPRLFEYVEPIFNSNTVALFLKGRTADAEVDEARKAWSFAFELLPSMTDAEARIAVIRELEHK